MPRYNDTQRESIYVQLRQQAAESLRYVGVRKTSLEDLANRVDIPKPSFYLFYPSKEHLLYEVICAYKRDLYLK